MGFPAISTTTEDLQTAWSASRARAREVRGLALEYRNTSAAGDISTKLLVDYAATLANALEIWARAASYGTELVDYARAQLRQPTRDVAGEFVAMRNTATAVRDWIVANFPKDGGGYLLFIQFDADGRYTFRTLTTAQTAALRTQLDVLIAAIDA